MILSLRPDRFRHSALELISRHLPAAESDNAISAVEFINDVQSVYNGFIIVQSDQSPAHQGTDAIQKLAEVTLSSDHSLKRMTVKLHIMFKS